MGNSAQQIIMKIITEPAQPVTKLRKSVPPHVAAALATALEKLPADRFETAQAFSAALGDAGYTIPAMLEAGFGAGPVRGARSYAMMAAVGVVGIVLGALAMRGLQEAPPAPEVVRFSVDLPPGEKLRIMLDEDAPFALSPDGRRIAYVATDSSGERIRLLVRVLDQLEATEIPGVTKPSGPFFSPDGQWIGYLSEAENDPGVYKVPLGGGPPIRVANNALSYASAAAWSDDGWIYYTSSDGRLSRVSATGGEPIVVSPQDSARWRGAPSPVPGGKFVLVSSCSSTTNCTTGDVEILALATGAVRVLIPGAFRAWYLGDGIVAYGTEDGSVFAVPFDADRGELNGSAVPLLSQVSGPDPGTTRLGISASGAMMYQPTLGGRGSVDVVEVDRQGKPTGRLELSGEFSTPRYSPSADRVALARSSGPISTLWLFDVGSGTLSPLAPNLHATRPAWSPDGREIAFLKIGSNSPGIHTLPADGGAAPARIAQPETGGSPSYTRDGKWLIYDGPMGPPGNNEDIFAVSTETAANARQPEAVVASAATEESGAVSPDGRWIAYTADESGVTQVFVRPFRREGGRWLLSPDGATAPLWTTDRELTYLDTKARTLVSVQLAFTPDPRIVSRQALFDMRSYVASTRSTPQHDVSHDGKRFLLLRGDDLLLWPAPVVVLNWRDEVKRLMSGQGTR
jgi:serine/threonine-protein kinase